MDPQDRDQRVVDRAARGNVVPITAAPTRPRRAKLIEPEPIEAEPYKATGAFDPRVRCAVCGQYEGECIPSEHELHAEALRAQEEKERRQARFLAEALGAVPASSTTSTSTETCSEYFTRWNAARVAKGLSDAAHEPGRWHTHAAQHFGDRQIGTIAKRDIETFVQTLDDAVRQGRCAWATAHRVWGVITKMFDDATRAKDLSLRVLATNPTRDVRGPDRGDQRASAYLFPRELSALVSQPVRPIAERSGKVRPRDDLAYRRLYVLACYTGLRAGELLALAWEDVHETEGYILVHRATKDRGREIKGTKSGRARKVPIMPHLKPMLEAMRAETGGEGLVIRKVRPQSFATYLRADLLAAGVTRADLHADNTTQRPLTFHDLRHTCGTWLAVLGREAFAIQRFLGHADLKMTDRYVNEAHIFDGAAFGEPFGPVPDALLGRVPGRGKSRRGVGKLVGAGGFEPEPKPAETARIDVSPDALTVLLRALDVATSAGDLRTVRELARAIRAMRGAR